jgi:uncharacterized protein YjlB
MTHSTEPLTILFADDGKIPNNPLLPVVVYTHALIFDGEDAADAVERLFLANGWLPHWRDGIYDFHHYHSTAHEALGIAKGSVRVQLGGEQGRDFDLQAGDVAILPAGTGHKRLSCSKDLLVVGAYPPGQRWNILHGHPSERPSALTRIAAVPLPESDPVLGKNGPLIDLWRHRR